MNVTVQKGNLCRDPEIREIPMGEKTATVANFSIAVSRHYKTAGGENKEETYYFDCEAWDTGAVTIGKILKKGDPVLIRGSLKQDTWTDNDGNKRSRIKIRVAEFDKLARFVKTQETLTNESQPDKEQVPVAAGAEDDDDIGF